MKAILKRITSKILLRVKSGPLKNYRVIAGSGMKFIRGKYEEDTVRFFQENVKEGSVCYDIGGHVGYMSLILSKFSGKKGRVIVFEPRPINIRYIEKHVAVNGIRNIELFKIGLSDHIGETSFDVEHGTGTGRISEGGSLTISIDTLDNLINKEMLSPPDFIKMDIEGEELKAIKGGENLLRKYKPTLNISTHGDIVHKDCIDLVKQIGYTDICEIEGGFTAG